MVLNRKVNLEYMPSLGVFCSSVGQYCTQYWTQPVCTTESNTDSTAKEDCKNGGVLINVQYSPGESIHLVLGTCSLSSLLHPPRPPPSVLLQIYSLFRTVKSDMDPAPTVQSSANIPCPPFLLHLPEMSLTTMAKARTVPCLQCRYPGLVAAVHYAPRYTPVLYSTVLCDTVQYCAVLVALVGGNAGDGWESRSATAAVAVPPLGDTGDQLPKVGLRAMPASRQKWKTWGTPREGGRREVHGKWTRGQQGVSGTPTIGQ